jgi:single-strand DNA-binding protein|tara:strand:- start:96 stop:512 length:417 start_codon:yes stop_codon:yes gene_type:complete
MKSVNKVTLLGNVTRDPELKSTTGGQTVTTFGLATNRVWRDGEGEKRSLPEYHNLVAWGGLAEFSGQYVRKGKPLYIEGYLKTRSWDSGEGTKIFRTEVVLENIVLLGPKDGTENDPIPSDDVSEQDDVPAPSDGEAE